MLKKQKEKTDRLLKKHSGEEERRGRDLIKSNLVAPIRTWIPN